MTSGLAKGRAFGDDPVLGLLRLAHSVTVLTLKLPSQQIAAQLLNRTLGPAPKSILALKRFALDFSRTVRLAIRIALLAIAPILPESVIRRLKQSGPALRAWRAINRKGIGKIKRYEQRGWLDAVYRNWQTHLTTLSRDGIEIKQVFLVPNPSAHGEVYSWRIELPPDYNNGITGVSGLSAGRS
jgi:hypothetical protein